ncbi:hypothetical protein J6X09_01160, partial [Candidatus Saccharibacteria bacterium]|nr:hypothetical protein [Candidatus Saccharibacteria bacterium]
FCQTLFDAKSDNATGGMGSLKGDTVHEGASNIVPGDDIVQTFKCPACGAEVVINTNEVTSASCHWCRHIFSVNEKISNGAVPDLVLPFKLTKEEAIEKVREAVDLSSNNLSEEFRNNFKPEEVRGVYFPYMIIDLNTHWTSYGEAQKTEEGSTTPPYRYEEYNISREFDLLIDDLTVESSAGRLNQDTYVNSNNIINAILPFDTENAVAWNADYLRGYASERRNVDTDSLKEVVALQTGDVARRYIKEAAPQYDRGTHGENEHLKVNGSKWKAAYLPVWLYSYKPEKESRIYYVAVNARTGETVGCVPTKGSSGMNIEARHHHENETHFEVKNLKASDKYSKKGKSYKKDIDFRNDTRVIGSLSHGRSEMIGAEQGRFALGKNYTHQKPKRSFVDRFISFFIWFIIIAVILIALFTPSNGHHGSSSSSSSSSSYDSSSSWDSGGSYDSGGSSDSSSGFSYDW